LRADLVVLAADPALDARNLAKVAYTIRDGRIIYQHPVEAPSRRAWRARPDELRRLSR
jgi:hypothetical protein